jgi:hypothetical protein
MPKTYNAAGYVADPTDWYQPEPASGVAATVSNVDTVVTVVPGARYMIHNIDATSSIYAGYADLSVAANRLWVITPGQHIGINIPEGITSLRFLRTAAADVSIHYVKVLG